ncbi:hypothetical protein O0I10_004355 [Lichtheimia ornata]|uniref:AB hydrolase-1 domain-containing protein n=1 Tax=Lichtheimia ornata TaxID=688661 RepID=A0AAD7V8B8_9FUNG|nr:uncharacterized protein O0I10_004355 [Lichtheimia ornata]KAJ8659762.1 hypothetical protein O0I10_004355 [Lichtheimia ornata]
MNSHIIPVIKDSSGEKLPLHVFFAGSLEKDSSLVILLHGAGGDHYHFGSIVPRLIHAGYAVLTLDLRGHGESQVKGDDDDDDDDDMHVSFESMANDLDVVLQWLKDKFDGATNSVRTRVFVGGLSMGGMLAQVCAHQKKARWLQLGYDIEGVIAIACPSVNMIWPRIPWMDVYRGISSMDPDAMKAAREAIILSAVEENGRKETARAMDLINDITLFQSLRSCADALPRPPPPPCAPKDSIPPHFDANPLKLPLLLVTGSQDEHTVKVMHAWQQLNEDHKIGSRFKMIDHAGHMVPLDAGTHLADAILKFLAQ